MHHRIGGRRWLATTASAIGLMVGAITPGHADPRPMLRPIHSPTLST